MNTYGSFKGGLVTEGILTLVPLPTKGAESLPWNLNFPPLENLFKFSAQGSNLAPFVGNGTEVKILSEIMPQLSENYGTAHIEYKIIYLACSLFYLYKLVLVQTVRQRSCDCFAHTFFTIMNIKRKGTFQFCFPWLLGIHRNPNWKEFLKCCESFWGNSQFVFWST